MDDELKKILDEISQNRKSYKANGNFNDFVVNMDFATLYSTAQRVYNIPSHLRLMLRKEKIKRKHKQTYNSSRINIPNPEKIPKNELVRI